MIKIGIAGYGFVGKAVHYGFSELVQQVQFTLYDPYTDELLPEARWKERCKFTKSISDLRYCDFVFICVPTPTNFAKGEQDTSIVEDVITQLRCFCAGYDHRPTIVIKSTVKPGTTKKIQEKDPRFNILFNPEFLVEKTYLKDFLEQDRIVIGGDKPEDLINLYKKGWPEADFYPMDTTEAELVKYGANAFLATKVAFFNELYFLSSALEIDYSTVAFAICDDERIGSWGNTVPGQDNQYGFGGKCFPKDLVTLLRLGKDLCVPNFVVRGAWQTNEAVREKKDWLDIKGASTDNLHG